MRSTSVVVLFALLLGLWCGCGAARPSKYYQLTIPGELSAGQPTPSDAATLLVAPIAASHLYRGDRVVYSTGSEMGTYEYQRWAEPPTEMLEEMLIRELRESGRYRGVYPQSSSARGDYLVRGHLYDFREISNGSLSAKVTIELELRQLKTDTTVWTHFYSHEESVASKDVPAVIAALNRNAQRGVCEFVGSLNQYFAAHTLK